MAINIRCNRRSKLFCGIHKVTLCFTMLCIFTIANCSQYLFPPIDINNSADEYKKLGVNPGDLGSNSSRKGVCGHTYTGTTVLPSTVSI